MLGASEKDSSKVVQALHLEVFVDLADAVLASLMQLSLSAEQDLVAFIKEATTKCDNHALARRKGRASVLWDATLSEAGPVRKLMGVLAHHRDGHVVCPTAPCFLKTPSPLAPTANSVLAWASDEGLTTSAGQPGPGGGDFGMTAKEVADAVDEGNELMEQVHMTNETSIVSCSGGNPGSISQSCDNAAIAGDRDDDCTNLSTQLRRSSAIGVHPRELAPSQMSPRMEKVGLQPDSDLDWHPDETDSFAKSRLGTALVELRQHVSMQWDSVSLAAECLSVGVAKDLHHEGIAVAVLHASILQTGYCRSCAEVCVLLQALGIACSELSTISAEELCRLETFEAWVDSQPPDTERLGFTLGMLQIRRVLAAALTPPERLLADVYVSLQLLTASMGESGTESDRGLAALMTALRAFHEALRSEACIAHGVLEIARSMQGLHVLVGVIKSARVSSQLQLLAASTIAKAVGQLGTGVGPPGAGSPLRAPPKRPLHTQESRRRQRQLPLEASLHTCNKEKASPPAEGISMITEQLSESRHVLAIELWWPLLEFIDPEAPAAPPPLSPVLVSSLLKLLVMAGTPTIVGGPHCASLVPGIISGLRQLHASPLAPASLDRLITAFHMLEESHLAVAGGEVGEGLPADVHLLCAALGGCRLLREQLAQLPKEATAAQVAERGEHMLRSWHGERRRLQVRWGPHFRRRRPMLAVARLEALAKAVREAQLAGFDTPLTHLPSLLASAGLAANVLGGQMVKPEQQMPAVWDGVEFEGNTNKAKLVLSLDKFNAGGVEHKLLLRLIGHRELSEANEQDASKLTRLDASHQANMAAMPCTARQNRTAQAGLKDGMCRPSSVTGGASLPMLPWTVAEHTPRKLSLALHAGPCSVGAPAECGVQPSWTQPSALAARSARMPRPMSTEVSQQRSRTPRLWPGQLHSDNRFADGGPRVSPRRCSS